VRFLDEKPEDLTRARDEISAWRRAHPEGTPEQLIADVGRHFHPDWTPVLRALLYVTDKAATTTRNAQLSEPSALAARVEQPAAQPASGGCRE
jgi:hypothetical protein